jgi:hypothetical protein
MPCSKLLAATCGKGSSLRPTALSAYGTSASQTRHHPVVFHPDMRIQPVDEKHRSASMCVVMLPCTIVFSTTW